MNVTDCSISMYFVSRELTLVCTAVSFELIAVTDSSIWSILGRAYFMLLTSSSNVIAQVGWGGGCTRLIGSTGGGWVASGV